MSSALEAKSGGTRILYIDDDETLGILLKKNLGRLGFEVVTVLDGMTGLALLAGGDIDAIALDHYLLGETGLDILPEILKRPDHPPVVYVTGAGDTRIAVQALKSGADDYVTKNVSTDFFELLAAALNQALERAGFRRETKLAHELMRQERDRAELLLREVNHRVGNSLGLAAALIRMQASLLTDPVAIQALQETQARINAIGNVHRHLYVNNQVGSVQVDAYLTSLLDELQSSMRDDLHPHTVVLDAQRIHLSTDKVVTLGLIVSELVTNAFKYAYAEGQAGDIRVSLQRRDSLISLRVEDDGRGFDPDSPALGTGLGSRIIAAMAQTMGCSLVYDVKLDAGTRVEMMFAD
ncbi:sensor histidine kinase [Pararhizobium antarcticum]|uniref:histidine kinase n=1 Tax=Pararhizobium antarcticum TaxID=1798805 RepID=A0A657LWU5_9HYPH|nr:histidine kinase dimerization/phosphoacceptor domain -containing protein [Pararhizobium antarcticum]OJF97262.1 two-component system sensor histidine kinase/response regulator [Rhizobium sp. 58]OJF99066.1 two-component system sensor histidine kinase/response regulator [Pararhizobium antarcticum]